MTKEQRKLYVDCGECDNCLDKPNFGGPKRRKMACSAPKLKGAVAGARDGRPQPLTPDEARAAAATRAAAAARDRADVPRMVARMNEKARRALLGAYEQRMLTRCGSALAEGHRSIREWVWLSASNLAGLLLEDPACRYRGFRWR